MSDNDILNSVIFWEEKGSLKEHKRICGVMLVFIAGLSIVSCNSHNDEKKSNLGTDSSKEQTMESQMLGEQSDSIETGDILVEAATTLLEQQTTIEAVTTDDSSEQITTSQQLSTLEQATDTKDTTTKTEGYITTTVATENNTTSMTQLYTTKNQDGSGAIDETTTQRTTEKDTNNDMLDNSNLKAKAETQAVKYQAYAEEVLCLVNEIRANVGVAPLTLDTKLNVVACIRALEMDYTDSCSHVRADGSKWDTALNVYPELDYNKRGENIGAGYKTPEDIVEAWKNSKAHYTNMISPDYKKMGVGYSNENDTGYAHFWAQTFTD